MTVQQTFISRRNRVLHRTILNDASVDEKQLPVAIGARELRPSREAADNHFARFFVAFFGVNRDGQHLPRHFASENRRHRVQRIAARFRPEQLVAIVTQTKRDVWIRQRQVPDVFKNLKLAGVLKNRL